MALRMEIHHTNLLDSKTSQQTLLSMLLTPEYQSRLYSHYQVDQVLRAGQMSAEYEVKPPEFNKIGLLFELLARYTDVQEISEFANALGLYTSGNYMYEIRSTAESNQGELVGHIKYIAS
jgi:hypothetical protein